MRSLVFFTLWMIGTFLFCVGLGQKRQDILDFMAMVLGIVAMAIALLIMFKEI